MNFVNFNGKILSADSPIFPLNRAINYGDGMFEGIRIHDGEILFLENHFERMCRAMRALKIEVPEHFSSVFFHKQIVELAREEKIAGNARVRIVVYRNGGGLYEPEENSPIYFIEVIPMQKGYVWSDSNCTVGIFQDVPKNFSSISFFKSLNSLPYIMAAIFKKENNLGDCLLLSSTGNVADAISSNVFWVKGEQIFSPPVSDGGVEGVMRGQIIHLLAENGFGFSEQSIAPEGLKYADEIFLTNVGWGIKSVTSFQGKQLSQSATRTIFSLLINTLKA